MCQMSVFVKDDGKEELLRENVTNLEILDKSIRISSLFEGPADLEDMVLRRIDFSAGKVLLEKQ
jgi:predicted RNA-binding protein